MKVDGDAIVFHTTETTGTDWHVQAYQPELDLKDDKDYVVKFQMKSPENRSTCCSSARINEEDWHEIGLHEDIQPTEEFKDYEFEFTATRHGRQEQPHRLRARHRQGRRQREGHDADGKRIADFIPSTERDTLHATEQSLLASIVLLLVARASATHVAEPKPTTSASEFVTVRDGKFYLRRQAVLLHRHQLLVRAAVGVAGRNGRSRATGAGARLSGRARHAKPPHSGRRRRAGRPADSRDARPAAIAPASTTRSCSPGSTTCSPRWPSAT